VCWGLQIKCKKLRKALDESGIIVYYIGVPELAAYKILSASAGEMSEKPHDESFLAGY